ncbi:MAG: hypothetical protein GKS06_16835 [Acidobacteria bacterium]|nr:hypothetical protein [Acidobacteriota bacterium]
MLPYDGPVRRAPWEEIEGRQSVTEAFEAATGAGDEGSVFKLPGSTYQPGRRGRAWVKLKRPLGTLDVVVTGAEWGRGKRAGMLSDLIFAVRQEGELIDAGRAYSGLTDQQIRELTDHFKDNTLAHHRVGAPGTPRHRSRGRVRRCANKSAPSRRLRPSVSTHCPLAAGPRDRRHQYRC